MLIRQLFVALLLCIFLGCSHGPNERVPTPASEKPAKLTGPSETFTGKVVLAAEGYRLKMSDETEDALRLTRAKKRGEFAAEEIHLKKYYEKTLAVHGTREGEWIWDADIVGQWLHPGESRGPNVLAPRVKQ